VSRPALGLASNAEVNPQPPFMYLDREPYKATVEGRIIGIGKTIRIRSIHVHYDLPVPPDSGRRRSVHWLCTSRAVPRTRA
jgi:hypothetical protein